MNEVFLAILPKSPKGIFSQWGLWHFMYELHVKPSLRRSRK